MELFRNDGGLWVDPKIGRRQVGKQRGVRGFDGIRGNRVTEADIGLYRTAGARERSDEIHPNPAIVRVEADFGCPDGPRIEDDPVSDGKLAEIAKYRLQSCEVIGSESQEIDVARRAVRRRIPEVEEQGALEQELIAMRRNAQPVQEPLKRKSSE
jgi:hypothetical protein